MARPERRDVDYFPFLVKDGKTLFILEGKYGCKGTGFFTNVMRFLCSTPDHHYQIKDVADSLFFFTRCHCDEESGMDMLNIMANTGKICSDMWVSYKVIVSEDLLNSIKDAYRNRKKSIITIDQIRVSYAGNRVSDTGNTEKGGITDVDNPQSKVKESKVKKKLLTCWPDDFVLTDHLRQLASKYIPDHLIETEWEAFKAYSLSNGKKYASWEDAWKTRYLNYAKFNQGKTPEQNKPGVWS